VLGVQSVTPDDSRGPGSALVENSDVAPSRSDSRNRYWSTYGPKMFTVVRRRPRTIGVPVNPMRVAFGTAAQR